MAISILVNSAEIASAGFASLAMTDRCVIWILSLVICHSLLPSYRCEHPEHARQSPSVGGLSDGMCEKDRIGAILRMPSNGISVPRGETDDYLDPVEHSE